MTGESAKFTRKKEQAIANLIRYPTIAEAAKATGIAEVTLFRWLQDHAFAESYRQARREVVSQAIAQLQHGTGEAVEALRSVMNGADTPPSARVSAARSVLDMALRAVEIEDLEERIGRLEQLLEGERP